MKLPTDWEWQGKTPFLDVGVGTQFLSHLPSEQSMSGSAVDELFGTPAVEYASMSFQNVSDLSIRSIWGVGHNWGIENFKLDSVGQYTSQLLELTKLPAGMQMKELARTSVMAGLDMAFSALGVIPIWGWVLEGAWEIGKLLVEAIEGTDESVIPLPALTYNANRDQDLCRRMLSAAKTNDWTKVFQPSVVPSSFEGQLLTFGADRDGIDLQGYAVRPKDFRDIDGMGVIPGLPRVFGNIQLPRVYGDVMERPLGWGQKPPFCAVTFYGAERQTVDLCKNTGSFLPSVSQLGFALWSMARTNSPNAFKIDHGAILSAWQGYFAALTDYIEAQGDSDKNSNSFQRSYAAQQLSTVASCRLPGRRRGGRGRGRGRGRRGPRCVVWKSAVGTIPGFGAYLREAAETAGKSDAMFFRPRAGRGSTVSRGDLIPNARYATFYTLVDFFIRDQFEACQRFLNTTTVAYVDETFPAIANNIVLRKQWEENRAKLLEHPARFGVELDMIPATSRRYRDKMARAQSLGGVRVQARGQEPIVGKMEEDNPKYPRPPATTRKKKGIGLLAAGAAVALAVGSR